VLVVVVVDVVVNKVYLEEKLLMKKKIESARLFTRNGNKNKNRFRSEVSSWTENINILNRAPILI